MGPLYLLLNSRLFSTAGKSCILDPIPGILMEDCYAILLPVIVPVFACFNETALDPLLKAKANQANEKVVALRLESTSCQ